MLATVKEREKMFLADTPRVLSVRDLPKEFFNDLYLCFADNGFLYFTNKKAKYVRGDDWNDAPLEHNASEPYLDDVELYAIVETRQPFNDNRVLTYDEIMAESGVLNSEYSVDDVNTNGNIPWAKIEILNDFGDTVIHMLYPNDLLVKVLYLMSQIEAPCKIELGGYNKEKKVLYNFQLY